MSILDTIHLDKDTFERCIMIGRKIPDMCLLFNVDRQHLDDWVRVNYNGLPLQTVFDIIRQNALMEFQNAMLELGVKGNPSAMHIAREMMGESLAQDRVVKIVFDNAVPLENEKDKENDERGEQK